jgi:hypothetical protein
VKAGRALVHGAADVATFGLWEVIGIPAEAIADGTDVKVEVKYDAQQVVQSVTVFEGEGAVHPKSFFARAPKEPSATVKATDSATLSAQRTAGDKITR